MQVICPVESTTKKILGNQKFKQKTDYRMLLYCQKDNVEEGTIIYNLLTKEMIFLSEQEAAGLENFEAFPKEVAEYLISNWFFVPIDTDEKKLYHQVKAMFMMLKKKSKNITSYTILTTVDCNARCFYCYELGRKRTPMSEQTASDVAEYIKKSCGSNKVHINWFGGEPLYNSQAIDIICDSLSESNIEFDAVVVSNAYLFDEKTIKKAKENWNVKAVQITLDGTEEVYNRTKAFIYKEENAFERVVNNIENLLRENIKIIVRLNMGTHNTEDLYQLCDYLDERFHGYKNFSTYVALLFENESNQRTAEERREIYEKSFELQDYLIEKGIYMRQKWKRDFVTHQCQADSDHCVIILPDGNLGKCEHFSESETFGSIYSDERDEEMIASWKELRPENKECNECIYYPECVILKKCPDISNECYPEERLVFERETKMQMQIAYDEFKKDKESN